MSRRWTIIMIMIIIIIIIIMIIMTMIRRWTTTSPPPYLQRAGTHCLFRQGRFIDPHNITWWSACISFVIWRSWFFHMKRPSVGKVASLIIILMMISFVMWSSCRDPLLLCFIMLLIEMISRNNNIVTRIIMNSFNRNLPPSFWDSSWVSPSLPREEAYQDPYSGSLLRQILGQSGYFGPTCAIWTILGHPEPFLWILFVWL